MPDLETPFRSKSCNSKRPLDVFTGKAASSDAEYTRLVLSNMSPALCLLQYSNKLIVPKRLCSINCLLEDCPSRPARTDGFAAQSITQSTLGRPSISDWERISPRIRSIPRVVKSEMFNSDPFLEKLSSPMICKLE